MFEYPCPLLKAFFAIPSSELAEDLERAVEGVDHIRWELSHLMTTVRGHGLENSVRINHLLIIQAYAISRRPELPLEVKACYAQMTAGLVGCEAQDSAYSTPRGREICRQIDEIEEREGLTGEAGEQGPPEYDRLNEELGAIGQEAHDKVFLRALRRYRMEELAALYESDHDDFNLLATIGSRVLGGSLFPRTPDKLAAEDRYILKKHGLAMLRRVRQRVEELREEVGEIEGPWPRPDG